MENDKRELDFFSRYLPLWITVCIILGTVVGYLFPSLSAALGGIEVANVSIPVAVVLLVMMYPIMLKISIKGITHAIMAYTHH